MTHIKLTQTTKKAGCGCKIGPSHLSNVFKMVDLKTPHPDLLVGTNTFDDAGVFRLNDDLALVQTVDFFTPIVDDPYAFGQIAAANAISDIYAMGGTPLTALNIVGYPITKLPPEVLAEILRGGTDKAKEAGVVIMGGHSIDDQEPKFGMAVTGTIHPDKIWTNSGARPGDVLILTKPIGVGITTTAIKRELAEQDDIEQVIGIMTMLNKKAAEIGHKYTVHACTDVTGFGLLGHSLEMANGSNVRIEIYHDDVPVLPKARLFAIEGAVPGGTKNNLAHVSSNVDFASNVDYITQTILADAVTSGGLLMAVPEEESKSMVKELFDNGLYWSFIIGKVFEGQPRISVL